MSIAVTGATGGLKARNNQVQIIVLAVAVIRKYKCHANIVCGINKTDTTATAVVIAKERNKDVA